MNRVCNSPFHWSWDYSRRYCCSLKICAVLTVVFSAFSLSMAQTTEPEGARWLSKAELASSFIAPESKAAWELKRQQVRSQLWELLGHLPPRPPVPKAETLESADRGEYRLEKFRFDNEAGATVPGYILLPKKIDRKAPAVLFCHWHGGEYE